MGIVILLEPFEKLLKRREIKTRAHNAELGLDEIQAAMFADIDSANKIVHATYDKQTISWIRSEFFPLQKDFGNSKQWAKSLVTAFKTMIWSDKFVLMTPERTLSKFKEIDGGWRIDWDENGYMEIYYV